MSYKVIEIRVSPSITASFMVSSKEMEEFVETFDVIKDHGYVQPIHDDGAVSSARRILEKHARER